MFQIVLYETLNQHEIQCKHKSQILTTKHKTNELLSADQIDLAYLKEQLRQSQEQVKYLNEQLEKTSKEQEQELQKLLQDCEESTVLGKSNISLELEKCLNLENRLYRLNL